MSVQADHIHNIIVLATQSLRIICINYFNLAHVIYQAYLISSSTTSHELIELVLKRADIVDDPYRYYVYENCMDEDSSKL